MKQRSGYLMVAGAALCWGLSATAAKALLTESVSTVLLVQMRATFAAAVMAGFLALFKRSLLRVRVRDLWKFALLGIAGVAGSNFTYYFAIREGTVAIAIVLQYSAPLLVMAYAAWTGEESVSTFKVAAALVAIAGCTLAVGGVGEGNTNITPIGIASGILSAFCFGFMTVYTRHLLERYSVWTVTCYSLIGAAGFWLLVNPPWEIVARSPEAPLWATLAGFAMVSVLIPHTLFFAGLRHVVASRAIIVSTMEPVIAIVSAALVIGEAVTGLQLCGAAIVLAAIIGLQARREPGGEELPGEPHAAR
jgi:drug/metabolite transporter (DMT)-like permease